MMSASRGRAGLLPLLAGLVSAATALAFVPGVAHAQLTVNPELTNGDFEDGDLTLGWTIGGHQNRSVTRIDISGNHVAKLEVGDGPFGDPPCTDPNFDNFGILDQLFTCGKNHLIELDFLVPLPGDPDPTENSPCPEFDRTEIDFAIVEQNPFVTRLAGVLTIEFNPRGSVTDGHMQVNDFVLGTVESTSFDPNAFVPTTVGPLSVEESTTLPGWLHLSMEISTCFFPWLPDDFTFRVSARNADKGFTGQQFSLCVDNVSWLPLATPACVDVKPGSDTNPINLESQGVIPVALLGSCSMDVNDIDPDTVSFGPDAALEAHRVLIHYEDVNGDGVLDAIFHFPTQESGIQEGDGEACIFWQDFAGNSFSCCDYIRVNSRERGGSSGASRSCNE